jgi:predicted TIM-barrel fold metal-dependent hydrolase
MIVDAHCHAGQGDGLTGPWDTSAPLGAYLRRACRAGIQRTVIFAPFHSDYAVANRAIARLVASHPRRFIGFAFVHAQRDAGRIRQMVGQAVRAWGFRGIKVHRLDAPATREVCDVARAYALPVLYDVVGEPYRIELLATEYPDVNFIVPHLGSFADDWRAHVQVIDQLVRFPNVYADTAGTRRFEYLLAAVRRAGPRKLIFGSDGPWLHPGLELHKIRLLGLAPEARALIEGGNIQRLLPRQPAQLRRPTAPGWPSERLRPAPRTWPTSPSDGRAGSTAPGRSRNPYQR